jgi:hypothetical protein
MSRAAEEFGGEDPSLPFKTPIFGSAQNKGFSVEAAC